ncbi:MAG: hypothetical protein AAGU74_12130, partial [Bacillota bacterium]
LQSLLRPAPFSPALASLSPSYILPLISQKAQTLLDFFDKLKRRAEYARRFFRGWERLVRRCCGEARALLQSSELRSGLDKEQRRR